jgi:hypothetical protein
MMHDPEHLAGISAALDARHARRAAHVGEAQRAALSAYRAIVTGDNRALDLVMGGPACRDCTMICTVLIGISLAVREGEDMNADGLWSAAFTATLLDALDAAVIYTPGDSL